MHNFFLLSARTYLSTKIHRKVERPDEETKIYSYKHTKCDIVSFSEAWKRFWIEHPIRDQPYARNFEFCVCLITLLCSPEAHLRHISQVEWFSKQFANLIDKNEPALPIGKAIIMTDFSEHPMLQTALLQKTSQNIYEQQPFLLGPTPCLIAVPDPDKLKKQKLS